jgi:hypothetical protein
MKYVCTISDINYLNRGLSLVNSLNKHNNDVFVYYLCMDKECYEVALSKKIKNIKFILIDDLINDDSRFDKIIPSEEAIAMEQQTGICAKKMELNYKMSSYFPEYCFNKFKIDHIIYSDSDIYFYESLDSIYQDIEDKSMGLVEHRVQTNCGLFNVGIVFIKNDKAGREMLHTWINCVMNPDNIYAKDYGTCGDQKYLELLYKLYKNNIKIIGEKTGHLAPWNLKNHGYTIDGKIIWNGNIQKLTYIHFSNFTINLQNDTFIVAPRHGIHNVTGVPWLNDCCIKYFNDIKNNS